MLIRVAVVYVACISIAAAQGVPAVQFGQSIPAQYVPASSIGDGVTKKSIRDWYVLRASGKAPMRRPTLRVGTEMQTGEVGVLPHYGVAGDRAAFVKLTVEQIVSENIMLVNVDMYGWRGQQPEIEKSTTVAVKTSTAGLADDDSIKLPGWWYASGTAKVGSRTVSLISPADDVLLAIEREIHSELAEAANKEASTAREQADADAALTAANNKRQADREKERQDAIAKQEAERIAAEKEARQRTWTSVDGLHVVKAEFLSYGAGVLRLRRLDNGKEITIPENNVSPVDMAWIKSRRK